MAKYIINEDSEVIESYDSNSLCNEEIEVIKTQYSESNYKCCVFCRSQEEPIYLVTRPRDYMSPEEGDEICRDCDEVYESDNLTLYEFYLKTQ